MTRRVTMLTLAAGVLLSSGCCWWRRCNDGCLTSFGRGEVPCHLAGRGSEPIYDGGVPVPGPAVGPGAPYLPGPGPLPNELPMPQPSGLIPAPNVPVAPPSVAPDPGPGTFGGLRGGTRR